MNIGTIIKKLRRERDMTQDQIAEYVNVTAQAVSRWETGASLPDITQVPVLANVFGVSTDHLLGVDVTKNEERIAEIVCSADDYSERGLQVEAVKILREALKEFPTSYKIMANFMDALWYCKDSFTPDVADIVGYSSKESLLDEVIAIGEKILTECTDDSIRHSTIQILCYTYPQRGAKDKAIALAEKMPNSVCSSDALLSHIYEGDEKLAHKQSTMLRDLDFMMQDIMHRSNDPKIILKALDLAKLMIEDENYGFLRCRIVDVCEKLADIYLKENDIQSVIKYVRIAAHHAVIFDGENCAGSGGCTEKEYTSLLFKGQQFGYYSTSSPKNFSQQLLDEIRESKWDAVRTELSEIEMMLIPHARTEA